MLSDPEKVAIRDSWRLVLPVADTAADLFYRRIGELDPKRRATGHAELAAHKKELVSTLSLVARALDWREAAWRQDVDDEQDLFLALLAMGRRRTPLAKLLEENYSAAGEALLWTLAYTLGQRFDARTRDAWTQLYPLLVNALRMGRLSDRDRPVSDQSPARLVGPLSAQRRGAAS